MADFKELEKKLNIKPITSNNMTELVPKWYAEYLNIIKEPEPETSNSYNKDEQLFLMNLILAANYLDIPSLLNLSCMKVGSLMKMKTPELIKQQFLL